MFAYIYWIEKDLRKIIAEQIWQTFDDLPFLSDTRIDELSRESVATDEKYDVLFNLDFAEQWQIISSNRSLVDPNISDVVSKHIGRIQEYLSIRNALTHSRPMETNYLTAIIDATPKGDLAYIVTEFNKPFTSNGFGNRTRKWCDEARLPHYSSHSLQKAMATRLADLGCRTHQIMAIGGWETVKEIERCARNANRKHLAAYFKTIVDGLNGHVSMPGCILIRLVP